MDEQARFLTGSTMRHVVIMSMAGMIGITFMFLVDAVTLFWVSKLGVQAFMAALGFVWTIQFITISISIGFMIATTALVSKSMGQGNFKQARNQATALIIITFTTLSILMAALLAFQREILFAIGARDTILELSDTFLWISVPSLPIMSIGMIGAAVLRAQGDAYRSMMITIFLGITAAIIDPLFIFGLDMGLQGAAWGISISRCAFALLALYYTCIVKNLLAYPNMAIIRQWTPPFLLMSIPIILTQLSAPVGNIFTTKVIADFGEGAIAGWAVYSRIMTVSFGGIFALTAAIGGIIGQNYGAEKFDRVLSTYRDSLIFSIIYVLIISALLALMTPMIISGFNLTYEAGEVVKAFTYHTAVFFIFASALYIANASFNNLGQPSYSMFFNWFKDGILLLPLCLLGSSLYGAKGVIYGQAFAWLIPGVIAGFIGWQFIKRSETRTIAESIKL